MITVGDLKRILDEHGVPDDAVVLIEADHGQHTESAELLVVTRDDPSKSADYGDMIFEHKNWNVFYDDDAVAEYDVNRPIRGVLITSF